MGSSAAIRILGLFVAAAILGSVALVYFWDQKPEQIAEIPKPESGNEKKPETAAPTRLVIGTSVEGRSIEAYSFGSGSTTLLFVGGIHGGYEWNSVLLAYKFIDHLTEKPDLVHEGTKMVVVPVLNPDGLVAVVGTSSRFALADVPKKENTNGIGRFNARGVDLNRNFDCKWQKESTWRGKTVSAGTAAFSEPEAKALRDYVVKETPDAVVFWHSKANAVYASECYEGVLPTTREVMNVYAKAAGYTAVDSFDAYPITGDAEGWLASIGIPAITIELATHESLEWEKNLKGVTALLTSYSSNLAR